jgi:long-chain acyl-CoA synthetase
MLEEPKVNSLCKLLLNNERELANQVYLRQPINGSWREFTWAETMLQARKVAGFLHQVGLKKGSHVSIISKNCAEWFITDFGIHLAGMVSVPLFSNQYEESIHYVLEHGDVELVFIGKLEDHQLVRRYIPEQYTTVSFDYHDDLQVNYRWTEVMETEPQMEIIEPAADALYTIIYTSGTTGAPKGAMYTNQVITNYLSLLPQDMVRIRDLPHYKLVSYLPLAHVYERSAIQLSSVVLNSEVSFIENLSHFVQNLQEIQPSLFAAVPRVWGVFQQNIEKKISPGFLSVLLKIPFLSQFIKNKIIHNLGFKSCSTYISGASSLPVSIMEFFEKLGIKIQEGYGQTENLAYAAISLLEERRYGYVGTPRLGVEIKLGEDNELLINSPCLMSGYYKEKQISKGAFTSEGWLRTGDIVEIDSQERIKILGRISEIFKNQTGEFVSPTPIEHQFEANEFIDQLCLVGRGLPSNVLIVTLNIKSRVGIKKAEVGKSLEDTLRQINNGLVRFEKISHILIAKDEWTPANDFLTPTLKVKRRIVEEHYSDVIQSAFKQSRRIIWE